MLLFPTDSDSEFDIIVIRPSTPNISSLSSPRSLNQWSPKKIYETKGFKEGKSQIQNGSSKNKLKQKKQKLTKIPSKGIKLIKMSIRCTCTVYMYILSPILGCVQIQTIGFGLACICIDIGNISRI